MLKFYLLVVFIIIGYSSVYAQCSSCTTSNTATSGNITVSTGDKLCLTAAGTFSGTINLQAGAMLCISSATTFAGTLNLWGTNAQIQNYGTWNTSLNMFNTPTFNNFGVFNVSSLIVGTGATFTSTTDVTVINDIASNGTFSVDGNLSVTNFTSNPGANATIGGNMNAQNVRNDGSMQIGGNANFTGTLNNSGAATLNITGNTSIAGNVENNATLTFQSSATLQGNLLNNGNLTFNTNFSITGDLENNNNSLIANGTGTIGGNVAINSANVDFNASITIGGNIAVNNSTLDFNASSSVGGNFDANGSSTVTVTEAALTIAGNLTNNASLQAGGSCGRFNVGGVSTNNSGTVGTNNTQLDMCDASNPPQTAPNRGWDVQFAGAGNFGSSLSYCTCVPKILPIEMVSFSSKNTELGIKLSWHTLAEKNNDYFLIEKAQSDNLFFVNIGKTNSISSPTTSINSYNFIDTEVSSSTTFYYRLKQVDTDGNFTYSPIISAIYTEKKPIEWLIEENKWTLKGILENEIINVIIYNSVGIQIKSCLLTTHSSKVDVSSLKKGLYIMKYLKGNDLLIKKVIR